MVTPTNNKKYKFTYSEDKPEFVIPFSVKFGRFVFRILSKISTRLSGKFATFLFFRPRNQPLKAYDNEMIARANHQTFSFNKRTIHIYIWGPPSTKKALFVHGWEGKGTSIKHFIDPLLAKDFQIISFDAPAHGNSSGSSTDLPEMIATVQHITSLYGPFDVVISHSFGSLATLHAFKSGIENKKLVLIASLANPFTAVKGFQFIFGLDDKVVKELLKGIHKRVGRPLDDMVLTDLNQFKTNKILLLHDTKDMIAPYSESIFLKKFLPDAEFVTIKDSGHHKILSNKITITTVINFISK